MIKRIIINKDNNNINWLRIITATTNDGINRGPAKIFIDKRFDRVRDWEMIEKISGINEIIKNSSILVKDRYNRYGLGINP